MGSVVQFEQVEVPRSNPVTKYPLFCIFKSCELNWQFFFPSQHRLCGAFISPSHFVLSLELAQVDLFSMLYFFFKRENFFYKKKKRFFIVSCVICKTALIKQYQKLIESHAQFVVKSLLDTLHFMHCHQIVHRFTFVVIILISLEKKKHVCA
ncbi:hypothetical protein RFI_01584 [Reticulomyxa filosa]|uniref:Uncharacterized protein n=1 Tax=Reticulomyxa filosa TaxID=46433 RepID=X6PAC5_RETFI|nr:hypothetical protein RFI_01584 [Reticulomyxa filosa]|eukprot:ETO35480.1 hypothetical protein RFI_01584 [Reticulomyxa filosa]